MGYSFILDNGVTSEYKEYSKLLTQKMADGVSDFLSTADEYILTNDGVLAIKKNSELGKAELFTSLDSLNDSLTGLPDELETSLELTNSTLKDDVEGVFTSNRYTPPEVNIQDPQPATNQASSNEPLTSIMIKNNAALLEAMHEQAKLLKTQNEINKKISDSMHQINESLKGLIELKSKENSILEHKVISDSATSATIAKSLTVLPAMSKDISVLAQTSITNLQLENSKRGYIADIGVGVKNQTDELKKMGDLADYELNGEIEDSSGEKLSPAKAKARKDAEIGLVEKQTNSFSLDEIIELAEEVKDEFLNSIGGIFNSTDFNIFDYVVDVTSEKKDLNNG
ncbi:MAG: hypothetical protein GXO30_04850 [Epsilonproteobacteria bacterium]|nr:hypothetical protein [Campylobacterota bacterium]